MQFTKILLSFVLGIKITKSYNLYFLTGKFRLWIKSQNFITFWILKKIEWKVFLTHSKLKPWWRFWHFSQKDFISITSKLQRKRINCDPENFWGLIILRYLAILVLWEKDYASKYVFQTSVLAKPWPDGALRDEEEGVMCHIVRIRVWNIMGYSPKPDLDVRLL